VLKHVSPHWFGQGGDYYTRAIAGLPMLFTLSLGQIVATK
jgi:hypothetical protein